MLSPEVTGRGGDARCHGARKPTGSCDEPLLLAPPVVLQADWLA
jgi:hypothetical protein